MARAIPRLHLVSYEQEPDRADDPDPEDERILDDAEVARLLLGAPGQARDRGRQSAVAIEPADEGDALAPMRGVLLGLVWTIALVGLAAAYLVLG
jgi:hypothetical protein